MQSTILTEVFRRRLVRTYRDWFRDEAPHRSATSAQRCRQGVDAKSTLKRTEEQDEF